MPLVYVGRGEQEPITEAHERARKVKPQYTGGEPVKVGFARNLAEAQLIQGILLEEGIPSFERRSRGFDVPDFLAGGPRDILVPGAGAEAARELLGRTPASTSSPAAPPSAGDERPLRLLAGILVALAIAAAAADLAASSSSADAAAQANGSSSPRSSSEPARGRSSRR